MLSISAYRLPHLRYGSRWWYLTSVVGVCTMLGIRTLTVFLNLALLRSEGHSGLIDTQCLTDDIIAGPIRYLEQTVYAKPHASLWTDDCST